MRYVRLLDNLRKLPRLDRIAFEEVRSHKRPKQRTENVTAAQVYGGYLATLSQWCEQQEPPIAYEGIPVGAIKKRATGKGNSNKEKVIEATRALAPTIIEDDNEADAFWVMVLACESAGISFGKKRQV